MPSERYKRFEINRPEFLGDEHWSCIEIELGRLHRSLEATDDSQVLGDLKCLLESVARITLDVAGEPAQPNDSLDKTVNRAHALLLDQPGHALARGGDFRKIATQSSKIARSLGNVRNEYGGGHGRSRLPNVRDEMVDLALDGSLTWTRWAVRRLGLFSEGRPDSLIRDLVEERAIFHSGDLRRRLEAANLGELEKHHQRELGVAVGQRAMQDTFVVRWDGVNPCLASDDLAVWPTEYRIGLLSGLWFDPLGHATITPGSVKDGLTVLDPIADCHQSLEEQIQRVIEHTHPGMAHTDQDQWSETVDWLRVRFPVRPAIEHPALEKLIQHLTVPF